MLIRIQDVNAGEVAPFAAYGMLQLTLFVPATSVASKFFNQDPWALCDGLLGRG